MSSADSEFRGITVAELDKGVMEGGEAQAAMDVTDVQENVNGTDDDKLLADDEASGAKDAAAVSEKMEDDILGSDDEEEEEEAEGEDDKMAEETEEKLTIDGAKTEEHEEEEHKDDGPKQGKAFEQIKKLKEEMEEKLKEILPAAFKSVRKLTVNIGPIKLADLKSTGLHGILNLTTHFEMTYDKQKPEDNVGQDKIRRFAYIEYDGFVKLRFEVETPQFFVLVYNKLTNLNINGRNMSVKLPEQFAETLIEAREYRKKREELYKELREETAKLRFEEKKRSVYVRNLSKNVETDKLKTLFPDAVQIIGPFKLGGGDAVGATLIYGTREEAEKCVEDNKELEVEEKKIKMVLISKDADHAFAGRLDESGKRKKRKKKKGGAEGGGEGRQGKGQGGGWNAGGGGGRKRRRGPFDEGMGMPPFPQGDGDPVAMMSMLRSTLSRMEDNFYGPGGGYMDDGYRGMMNQPFGGGGPFGPGRRTSLLGEPPAFPGFGGGMMDMGYSPPGFGFGGGMGGMGGGPRGRNRRRNKKK